MALFQLEDFEWGAVRRRDENFTFYDSFTYEGIEYRLFDCAYFLVPGQYETSIGKLVSMYETRAREKKVKVVWFFRPIEIRNFLGRYVPRWDELFLASGDGLGVYNFNHVDGILGKCNVLCISTDPRNPQPTTVQLRNSDYVFSRTFDTAQRTISEHFPELIAGLRVETFFNPVPGLL